MQKAHVNTQDKARNLIEESPYKVLVHDDAGQLDLMASLVATFENANTNAAKNSLGTIRRWDVSEGVSSPVENEPEYLVSIKRRVGHVDVLIAPSETSVNDSRPQLCLSLMVDAGLPTVMITANNQVGSIKQVAQGLPFDSLGLRIADERGLPEKMYVIESTGKHTPGVNLPTIESVTHSIRQIEALDKKTNAERPSLR